MRETSFDFGLAPFRIFHSWFSIEGFDSFAENTWKSMNIFESNGLIRLKKKLQLLKTLSSRLSSDQVEDLERIVNYDEVKRPVWDCGANKSHGLDEFSFELFCKFWMIIDQDVFQAAYDCFVNGHFPRGCNSSFIALIPKI
ncbi:hypothetical protein Tco_0557331 [Tanacetum coccineum]